MQPNRQGEQRNILRYSDEMAVWAGLTVQGLRKRAYSPVAGETAVFVVPSELCTAQLW